MQRESIARKFVRYLCTVSIDFQNISKNTFLVHLLLNVDYFSSYTNQIYSKKQFELFNLSCSLKVQVRSITYLKRRKFISLILICLDEKCFFVYFQIKEKSNINNSLLISVSFFHQGIEQRICSNDNPCCAYSILG